MSDTMTAAAPIHVALTDFAPLPEGDSQYPLEYIETNGVIKLREDDTTVFIGVCDLTNTELLEGLKSFHKKSVSFHSIEKNELSGYLGKRLVAIESGEAATGGGAPTDERILLDKLANDAPIVNLVNNILIEAIRAGSSDIHIESFPTELRVRYRVDGVLKTVNRIPPDKFPGVSSRIKIMSNLNIMERRLPQDGRLSVHLGEDSFDVRVSIVPITAGESIVMRMFNAKAAPMTLEELGFNPHSLTVMRKLVSNPNGLVLVTGPTGSGKSTTLNSVIREIRSDALKIITIEDPVEYMVDGVDQIQTHDAIGLTFDSILRRVLRQDPNVVMVGEVRDTPTAELAVRAALTGHLVLSSLHTNDSLAVIPRLKNMGVEPFLLGAVLRGAMAQRLVRKVCSACSREVEPSREEKAVLERYGLTAEHLHHGEGCDVCGGSGFKGRTAIVEIFSSDPRIEEMIVRNEHVGVIETYLKEKGFEPLVRSGLTHAIEGATTVSEVQKAVIN